MRYKKLSKKQRFIYILTMVVLIFAFLILAKKQQQDNLGVLIEGEEAVGVVTKKWQKSARNGGCGIAFYFLINNDTITYSNPCPNQWSFDNAEIGGKYIVRYMKDSPKKSAVIYIEEPIINNDDKINVFKIEIW